MVIMEVAKITPEALEVANTYLANGSINDTAIALGVSPNEVKVILDRREVKTYVDQVFLDQGYRNRTKLFGLMEEIIESKLEEARETEIYTSKDLLDVITLYHKMRSDEVKHTVEKVPSTQLNIQQNNVADNPFGAGNYGELMRKLLG